LRETQAQDYADKARRAAAIERLKEELETKRRVKQHVRSERREREVPAHTPVDLIPIQVECSSPFLHFPATPEDVRAVLAALPVGVVDGLKGIVLGLGLKTQDAAIDDLGTDPEPDPIVGRLGFEVFPGVYRGHTLALYTAGPRRIEVYGFVYDPAWQDRDLWQPYLRLHMLMSLVHEVAHHYDFTFRVARGRWRHDSREKNEIYAEEVEHDWIERYVIPHLEKAHPGPLVHLRDWMREQLGVEVPLKLLAGEVRATAKNGGIYANANFFNTAHGFEALVGDLSKGKDPIRARLQFARHVHYVEQYDLAMQIVETVLSVLPRDTEAILLKAELLVHLERLDPALQLAGEVLSREPDCTDALEIMADAYEAAKDWPRVVALAERLMDAYRQDSPWKYGIILRQRAWAKMELGDYDAVRADIEELGRGGRNSQIQARRLSEALQERLKSKS
jgi:tetratricopeptide (TPR) repeat protein